MPFFVGYYVFTAYGVEVLQSTLIATALTATSIAISIQVLTELGKMHSPEARLILGGAIVDDILAIAALSVVTTMVQTGNLTPNIMDITLLILKILGIFVALLLATIFIIPRVLHVERLWKSKGSVEGITTASFFAATGIGAACWSFPYRRGLCCWYGCRKYASHKTDGRLCFKTRDNLRSTFLCNNRSAGRP